MNNSVITYFDCSNGMVTPDIFTKVNGRGLGDSGNDLQLYGTKLYCVVNISERVEVMDAKTCKSLKAIALSGKQPRRVAFSEAYAYVSCYDGDVVKIDTATLSVVSSVYSGLNPDGICVSNGKLYVANSGGLNWESGYNNTVSVFSLPEMSRLKDITVVCNPTLLAADQQGDVYLMSSGNWNDIPMTLQRIDSKCDTVAQTFDFAVGNISIVGNLMYMYSYNWTTASSEYHILNLITEQVVSTHIISDGTKIQMPYGIYSNIVNGDIYICDTYNATVTGDCFCFDKNGKKKFEFETGINPSKIVILN
ncbi:MAG: hypothetical protein MJZ76_03085 [Bacteroidales bacterium]|nr:hypothetical protein [Bacteroidales bacterium]